MSGEMKEQYEMDKEKRERVAKRPEKAKDPWWGVAELHGHSPMPSTPKPDINVPPQRGRASAQTAWHRAEIERLKEELEKEREDHKKSEEKRIQAEIFATKLYGLIRDLRIDAKKLAEDYKEKSNNLFFLQVAANKYDDLADKSKSDDNIFVDFFNNIFKDFIKG